MSFEMLFTDATKITTVTDWLKGWRDNGSGERIVFHLSPERGGVTDIPPVPVPAAFWLFGTAIFGLIGMRRKAKLAA